jgi:1,4-dihydroxy-6-naphthoate synthase
MRASSFTLGISPCPNDTFIFEALLHGRVNAPFGVDAHMADVEELNGLAKSARLDISKLSLAAVPAVLDRYILLNTGAALGRGCGPLLLSRPGFAEREYADARIAIPGRMTTANLLLSLHGGFAGPRLEMVFDQVMPALLEGRADLGLVIHEGRFTYARKGLSLVLDMGDWWERESGLPLPLGLIAARRDLASPDLAAIQQAIRASLVHAEQRPEDGIGFIRAHAQEMDDAVMRSHIRTFVNEFSHDLGDEGRRAVAALLAAGARQQGLSLPETPLFAPAV